MIYHELKCQKKYFEQIWNDLKLFEIRYDDKGYKVNDILILRECEPLHKTYSGRYIKAKVLYILENFCGLNNGYVCMSLRILRKGEKYNG